MDGSFSTPSFNSVGEPYRDPPHRSSHGAVRGIRQFSTAPPKKGRCVNTVGDNPFDFKPLYGNEPFEDPHKVVSKERTAGKKKWLTTNGFKYSHPMKIR